MGDTPDRIRYVAAEPGDEAGDGPELPAWAGAAVELRIPIPGDEDGCEEVTWVYALRRAGPDLATGAGEMTRLGGVTQSLEEHGRLVGEAIRRIARALGLEATLVTALGRAGEWHDAGKSRQVWQLAACVPPGALALAKSRRGRFRPGWLGGYRHEFASVADTRHRSRRRGARGRAAPRWHSGTGVESSCKLREDRTAVAKDRPPIAGEYDFDPRQARQPAYRVGGDGRVGELCRR